MIAKAKNTKASGFDDSAASGIGGLLAIGKMLPAVEFDHQSGCMAHEISDVARNRNLAPEARSVQPVITQLRPKQSLCVGGIPSERACVGA
jgi:hypothetical protein